MKLYTKLPSVLKPYFEIELNDYKGEMKYRNFKKAWYHLERAHILGQQYPFAHTFVHWEMLKFGFITKNPKEIIGQIPRLIFGGVKSFVGKVPIGNPGGANVPPLKPFPVKKELQNILKNVN